MLEGHIKHTFRCEGCGKETVRWVFWRCKKLIKYCKKCSNGIAWRKKHPDYNKEYYTKDYNKARYMSNRWGVGPNIF